MKRQGISTQKEQMNLGDLINALKSIPTTHGSDDSPITVEYAFGTARPTRLGSCKGSYDELQLGYEWSGYDNNDEHFGNNTVELLIAELENALKPDVYFTGWKGGDFSMDEETPIWVSNDGNASRSGIVGVSYDDYGTVYLFTDLFDY